MDPVSPPHAADSRYAAWRLVITLLLMTIGSAGMYVMAVALTAVQAEFGTGRGDASLPYTLTMVGFGIGGIIMGRLADRFGVAVPVVIGAFGLGAGFIAAGMAGSLLQFALAHGVLIGRLGCSSTFAPLVADTALWFDKHRGIAVAICASGNYLSGTIWPPIMQYLFDTIGWRQTYTGFGIFCAASLLLLSFVMRKKPPVLESSLQDSSFSQQRKSLGIPPNTLMVLLCLAGVGCCVAMSMPQVHIVAYCGELGFGAARGAEMLSLMLGFGIVSRLLSGWISDHIGGLRTLILGSVLQGIALLLFLPFDGLTSLYVVSAMFGLFQGGIVPAYALIVREYFDPREAGTRVSIVLTATLVGMALGGWISGVVFDMTGSYRAAFINGVAFNLLNLSIAAWLLRRAWQRRALFPA